MNDSSIRLSCALTLFVIFAAAACTTSGSRSAPPAYRAGAPPGAQGLSATTAETYHDAARRHFASAPLFLPGSSSRQLVQFEVVGNMAVYQGDIMLGPVSSLPLRYAAPRPADPRVKSAFATANASYLWPGGTIPYEIDSAVSPQKRQDVLWAIAQVNDSVLTVRPRTSADSDFVVFTEAGGGHGCSSYVGRVGGGQDIRIAGCSRGSVIHEVMHAAGFYHEQCRPDRDEHVTIVWDEISPGNHAWFEKRAGGKVLGPYDYGSVMHYSARAFSKRGQPTIIPKAPNTHIGQREGLSQGDKAALATLYGGGASPPGPQPKPAPGAPPPAGGSFAGHYTSERGKVHCSQAGTSVTCQYPGGSMVCAARGDGLDCGWIGGGQGRAVFRRQPSGVLAGSWGDLLSADSRGAWNLVPAGAGAGQGGGSGASGPPPPAGPSLAGSYTSSRGPMSCSESGAVVTCQFNDSGTKGRLDCMKSQSGLELSCTWATFLPQAATGRAVFTRSSPASRELQGTFGHFNSASDGGTWNVQGQ